MNKSDIIAAIAEQLGISIAKAEKVFNGIFSSIIQALLEKDAITIPGFGSFSIQERAARDGRNPQTGEPIKIPSSRVPRFKPATKFKEAIKGGVKDAKQEMA